MEHSLIFFLAGPPCAGKTALGSRACRELHLRFLDLSAPGEVADLADARKNKETLEETIADRSADVVALPWSLLHDRGVPALARRSGALVGLWAHPLDMQERSGRREPLFTPSGRAKTMGGFGRNGTGCREFRRLERTCEAILLLVGHSLEDSVKELKDLILAIQEEYLLPPAEREGVDTWIKDWIDDYDADRRTGKVFADAIARYGLHLKSLGASNRKITAAYSDLDAAASLIFAYDAPRGKNVLDHFRGGVWELEYRRRYSDSPRALSRYRRTLEDFERYLCEIGLIEKDDD